MEVIDANRAAARRAGERRTPSTRMPNAAARSATAQPRAPAPSTASVCPESSNSDSTGGGRHCRSSCARTSAGSCRANASISPSTCSAMLIAWLPLPLVSTRWSLATSFGVEILSMPAPRWCSHCRRGAASRMASIGGPVQAIAAASARSRPFGRASPSSCRTSTPGRASRKTCSRSSLIGWRKAKVERRIGSGRTPGLRPRAASRS